MEGLDYLMKAPNLEYSVAEKVSRRECQEQIDEIFRPIGTAARCVKRPLPIPVKKLPVSGFVACLTLSESVLRLAQEPWCTSSGNHFLPGFRVQLLPSPAQQIEAISTLCAHFKAARTVESPH